MSNRSSQKYLSNERWIIGSKLCLLLNHLDLVVDWDFGPADVYNAFFQPLITKVMDTMLVLPTVIFMGPGGSAQLENRLTRFLLAAPGLYYLLHR